MNNQQEDNISHILEKIKNNELTVHTKTYFRLKLLALILVVLAICVVTLFFSSFILFTLRATGHASLIGFGGVSGLEVFLLLFPWKLLALEMLLIIVLEWLLRSFRFGYKVPVLYLFGGMIGLVALSAIIIDQAHLHDDLMRLARQSRLPSPFGSFYDGARRPPPPPRGYGIFRGTVVSISTSSLSVQIDNEREASSTLLEVTLPSSSFIANIKVGDKVFIAGVIENNELHARDLRSAPASENKE